MKNHKNRMGIRSGVTQIFNISNKLRLKDPLKLKDGDQIISGSIESWIQENPLRIWNEVYNTGKVELASDAHKALMQAAKQHFPDIYNQKEVRKSNHRKRNNDKKT